MDPIDNPFSLGAGNRPAALTGRDPELTQFETLLGRLSRGRSAQSVIISGLRGVGKTVLLGEFARRAESANWVVAEQLEVKSTTDFQAEIADRVFQVLTDLAAAERQLGERIKKLGRFLRAFKLKASADGTFELEFDPEKVEREPVGDLERDLTYLFVELGQVARDAGTGVVFLIDEMQFLRKEDLEAVAAAMHQMSQQQLPIALAGAGLPQLPGLLVDAKSYAERLFSYPRLDKSSSTAADAAVAEPLHNEHVSIHEDALRELTRLSDRYPAFIQAYAEQTWNTAPASPIVLEDVVRAAPLVITRLDEEFFSVRTVKATPREQAYMGAMADLGDGEIASSAVAERMGSTLGSVAPHRDSLIKKGLIYSPRHGQLLFTVPHFADHMRRVMPYSPGGEQGSEADASADSGD